MTTAAAYLRVSSRDQDLGLQRSAIRKAARARGDRIVCWFEEKVSARKLDRPQLLALRQYVREGRARKVYVFRIDRLSRSGIRDTLGVVQEFREHGCELATVADGFSLDGPGAEVVLAVIAWAAQMERRAIGERIAAARVRIEKAGGRWGKPRRVDPTTLDRARQMRAAKTPVRIIAAALKIPKSTISDALSGKGHYARSRTDREK